MAVARRNYDAVSQALRRDNSHPDRNERMQAVADRLWEVLGSQGASWVGFYVRPAPQAGELVLAVCRDKPACSPIGLHGACGRALLERRILIVRDVADLGENYIACDPRDRSEIVIPCVDKTDTCWGVLDIDSHESGAFDTADAAGLHDVLVAAGLTCEPMPPVTIV